MTTTSTVMVPNYTNRWDSPTGRIDLLGGEGGHMNDPMWRIPTMDQRQRSPQPIAHRICTSHRVRDVQDYGC